MQAGLNSRQETESAGGADTSTSTRLPGRQGRASLFAPDIFFRRDLKGKKRPQILGVEELETQKVSL